MYYDTYRGKKKRTRRRSSCMGWFAGLIFRLLAIVLVIVLLAAGALYVLPVALMNVEPAGMNLAPRDGLPGDRVNVLLLGLDFLNENQQRSDAMMVASIGNDDVRLTSLMRDTMVEIPGSGRHKLNSAYAIGGAEMAMRAVNETFGLNITNYIAVDLRTLVDVIDAVGGVEVSVTENEIENLNKNAWNTYKHIIKADNARYAHYADSQPVTAAGNLHLNGLFATAYTRIRAVDSDYMRTARQREVLTAIMKKMRESFYQPSVYVNLYDVYRNSVQTNLSLPELISLGEKALISGEIKTNRAPADSCITDDGSSIEITNSAENIRSLHEFIYN